MRVRRLNVFAANSCIAEKKSYDLLPNIEDMYSLLATKSKETCND